MYSSHLEEFHRTAFACKYRDPRLNDTRFIERYFLYSTAQDSGVIEPARQSCQEGRSTSLLKNCSQARKVERLLQI